MVGAKPDSHLIFLRRPYALHKMSKLSSEGNQECCDSEGVNRTLASEDWVLEALVLSWIKIVKSLSRDQVNYGLPDEITPLSVLSQSTNELRKSLRQQLIRSALFMRIPLNWVVQNSCGYAMILSWSLAKLQQRSETHVSGPRCFCAGDSAQRLVTVLIDKP
nr:hypothetical protein Iba_chr02eCG1540 [Ipomoea batatas]